MDALNLLLAAIAIILGFSLSSLISLFIEWKAIANKEEDNLPLAQHCQLTKVKCHVKEILSSLFCSLFEPITNKKKEDAYFVFIDILKVITSLFILLFWFLLVVYATNVKAGVAGTPKLYVSSAEIQKVLVHLLRWIPFIGLELILLLIAKICPRNFNWFSIFSNIVVYAVFGINIFLFCRY